MNATLIQKIVDWNINEYGLGSDEENIEKYNDVHTSVYLDGKQLILETPSAAGVMRKVVYNLSPNGKKITSEDSIYEKNTSINDAYTLADL